MAEVDVRDAAAAKLGTVALDDSVFGLKPNVAVMHQVVTAQLAGIRSGTQSTLTRAEVRGGGRKPWRQKGSGKARQGSIRAPHWRGGGVALGPKPRSYVQRTPKKMVQLALRCALSDRAAMGRVAVVDAWTFDKASTKDAKAALSALAIEGKALVVLSRDDKVALLSFRNLPEVHVILDSELNAYDVLCSDWVVFTRASLPTAPTASKSDSAPAPASKSDSAPAPAPASKSDPAPASKSDPAPASKSDPAPAPADSSEESA